MPTIEEIRANVNQMLDGLDRKSPISATVVFKVRKDREAEFKRNADALTRATLRLPGVTEFGFKKHRPFRDEGPEDPNAVEYMIFENWQTVEQFRAQWNSEHLHAFQNGVFELLAGPPELTFYEGFPGDGSGVTAVLPRTGQTRCYNSKGEVIPCAGTGQDAEYLGGDPFPDPRFADNGDGTVTDNLTGLVWLKNANLFGEVMRDEAIERARGLASGHGGLSDGSKAGDWRLPNVNELESLLDLNNTSGPAIPSGHPFTNLQAANYWSSTSVAAFPALGWYVATAVGPPVFDLKFNLMRMWPVRGEESRVARTGQDRCYGPYGQPLECQGTGQDGEVRAGVPWPEPRFTDNGDGTVTDHLTDLIWLKDGNPFGTRTWQQGLDDCNRLCDGQHGLSDGSRPGDWRMPNINELRSLEDYGRHTPALPADHPFVNVRQSLCWSSTTVTSAPNLARFLFVGIGSCVWDHKSVQMGVWPVRGGKSGRHKGKSDDA
jgi:quinol monooxygenase YgiN